MICDTLVTIAAIIALLVIVAITALAVRTGARAMKDKDKGG